MKDAILNDPARVAAERRVEAAKVLTSSVKCTSPVRKLLMRLLGRVWQGAPQIAPKSEIARLQRQFTQKTAAQLFKMRSRGEIEVQVERRRYVKNLPKITAGTLPTTLPALQFLESRQRSIEREMIRRGIIHEGD